VNIYTHPYAAAIWAISIALHLAVGLIALLGRSQRKHRFFAAGCLFIAWRSSMLFGLSAVREPMAYSTLFWATQPILTMFVFGQAWLSFSDLFLPIRSMPRKFYVQFVATFAAASALVVLSALRMEVATPAVDRFWFGMERTLDYWSTCTFAILSFYSDHYRIRWRSREYGIGVGYMLRMSFSLAFSIAYATVPREIMPHLFGPQIFSELLIACLWLYFFLKREPPLITPSMRELNELRAVLQRFSDNSRPVQNS
jgi:hypothetical protein